MTFLDEPLRHRFPLCAHHTQLSLCFRTIVTAQLPPGLKNHRLQLCAQFECVLIIIVQESVMDLTKMVMMNPRKLLFHNRQPYSPRPIAPPDDKLSEQADACGDSANLEA
jgi:hypothetical protein